MFWAWRGTDMALLFGLWLVAFGVTTLRLPYASGPVAVTVIVRSAPLAAGGYLLAWHFGIA